MQFGADSPEDNGDDEAPDLIDPAAGPAELVEQELTQERVMAARSASSSIGVTTRPRASIRSGTSSRRLRGMTGVKDPCIP